MSICLSSMSFRSFSNSAPAPDGGVGGRSDPAVPPNKAGRTWKAGTQEEERAQRGLRHAAAGLEERDAHPACSVAATSSSRQARWPLAGQGPARVRDRHPAGTRQAQRRLGGAQRHRARSRPGTRHNLLYLFGLGCDPDLDRCDEFSRRGLADMDAIGGDEFPALQVEAGPGLGHTAKGHFLDGLAGGRIHDGGDDTHRQADNDGRACLSMAAVDKTVQVATPALRQYRPSKMPQKNSESGRSES